MTIENENYRDDLVGDGTSVSYPYTFRILNETHIMVYVAGILQTLTTDYSVTNVGEASGNIVFVDTEDHSAKPANEASVTFIRNVPYTQETDLLSGGSLDQDTLETAYDKLTMLCQQLKEVISRCLQFTTPSLMSNVLFPEPHADYVIKWNALATALESAPITASGLAQPINANLTWLADNLTVAGKSVLDKATAELQRAALGLIIGTDVQVQSAILDWICLYITTIGNQIISATNAAAVRTLIGLGSIAIQAASSVAVTGGSITGITDLAIADGGTGASTATNARANLGLGTAATAADEKYNHRANNLNDVANVVTARNNLGLGVSNSPQFTGTVITGFGSFADLKCLGPWVDPRHATYGAHWNGTDDDTAHIQAAITANPGKVIFLAPGTPLITAKLTITAATATKIVGSGEAITNLYSTANQTMIEFDTTAGDIYYSGVSNLTIANNCSGTRTSASGIKIVGDHNLYEGQFRNIHSRGCYYAFEVASTVLSTQWCEFSGWLLDNYSSYQHYVGFLWNATCGMCNWGGVTRIKGLMDGGTGMAFMVGFGDGSIVGLNHYGGTNGIYIQKGTSDYSAYFNITGCKFDGTTNEIYLVDCDNFRCIGNSYCGTDTTYVTLGGTCTNYTIDARNSAGFTASYT